MTDYAKLSDTQLLAFLKEDDNGAYMEIYDRYNGLLFAYAYRKLQDRQESQDVVQEVFIGLWERRKTFVLKTYLSGFLYKSVLNRILDIFKHSKVIKQYAELQKLQIDVDSVETDYLIREKEIAAMIAKEIAAMPPRMREVYELKYKDFKSTAEIAAMLGISPHTVSNQLKNASAHLKKRLGMLIFMLYIFPH